MTTNIRPRQIMWGTVVLLFGRLVAVRSQFCERLYDDTWDALVEIIEYSSGRATLCGFTISGDGCHQGSPLNVYLDVFLACENFLVETECIIDCPGRHFNVHPGASLTLDRLTLSNSEDTSVSVLEDAEFLGINMKFERNWNKAGNGGAIRAAAGSRVSLYYSDFINNRAPDGGAIYNLGSTQIEESHFQHNDATNGSGGAVFSGQNSQLEVADTKFDSNMAIYYGPAIFDGSSVGSSSWSEERNNIGCGNLSGGGISVCDGISGFTGTTGVECFEFDRKCVPSTKFPSQTPSKSPTLTPTTSRPSLRPSVSPSVSPTERPSSKPSVGPSAVFSSLPSLNPSAKPSKMLSLDPSSAPSAEPTKSPSEIPSSHVPSHPPSLESSNEPSIVVSDVPTATKSNTPSPNPSLLWSGSPSLVPSGGPTSDVTSAPTVMESSTPSVNPSLDISDTPTVMASEFPTKGLTDIPSSRPTGDPSMNPTPLPSEITTISPSGAPSLSPSITPTEQPVTARKEDHQLFGTCGDIKKLAKACYQCCQFPDNDSLYCSNVDAKFNDDRSLLCMLCCE
jgi:hypothetical protein